MIRSLTDNYRTAPVGKAEVLFGAIEGVGSALAGGVTAWYLRPLSLALPGLALLALLAVALRLYTRHLRRENARLAKLVVQRTQELREATLHDPLTGLYNRRFLTEVVEPEVRSFVALLRHLLGNVERRRHDVENAVFALYMIDIDHFKIVNDQYGHAAGDLVLKQLSELLRRSIRDDDFAIRWGGEELLVVLKRTTPEYADRFALIIREKVQHTGFLVTNTGKVTVRCTCSVGFVNLPFLTFDPDLLSFEQTIMLADLGLSHAKAHGRNRSAKVLPGGTPLTREELPWVLANLDYALQRRLIAVAVQE